MKDKLAPFVIAAGAAIVGGLTGRWVQQVKRANDARSSSTATPPTCPCDYPADKYTPIYVAGGVAGASLLVASGELFVGILADKATSDAAATTAIVSAVTAIGAGLIGAGFALKAEPATPALQAKG